MQIQNTCSQIKMLVRLVHTVKADNGKMLHDCKASLLRHCHAQGSTTMLHTKALRGGLLLNNVKWDCHFLKDTVMYTLFLLM